MYASEKALSLLPILKALCQHHGKNYCFPSQLWIMAKVESQFDIKMSIATLNRRLRALQDSGFIRRIRRHRRDPILGMVFQSTLYIMTRKAYRHLARIAHCLGTEIKKTVGGIWKKAKKGPQIPERVFAGGHHYSGEEWYGCKNKSPITKK